MGTQVRLVHIWLDQTSVFRGEIRDAPGNVADAEERAEVILFTQDDAVIAKLCASMDRMRGRPDCMHVCMCVCVSVCVLLVNA
jgi:rRNA pseudouridine-1189 N-methylase Emg1 (Nep1/Mra1 family)